MWTEQGQKLQFCKGVYLTEAEGTGCKELEDK